MAWLLLYYSLELFKWLIIARAVMSWFVSPYSKHPLVLLIRRITDPVLKPLSDLIPPLGGMDVSPIVAFFAIMIAQRFIMGVA